MNLLIYTSLGSEALKHLISVIDKETHGENIEIFNTLNSLTNRITQIKKNRTIVILLIKNKKEFARILSIQDFLEGMKLILILPDHTESTILSGHKLFPNFLSFADGNFSDVGAVLNKMISIIRDERRSRCQLSGRKQTTDQEA